MMRNTNKPSVDNFVNHRLDDFSISKLGNTHISTQRFKILSHLKDGEPITSLDALQRYGCMRLASRISELKRKGIPIKSRFIKTKKGKQVKEYWLECA